MMKKILFLTIWMAFGLIHLKAQTSPCNFTYTQTGNTIQMNHMWILPLIYSLDSVYIDFGDGSNIMHYIPVPTTTNHTYTNPGTYTVCLTRYLSQLGTTTPIVCTYCDTVTIGTASNCFVTAGYNYTISGLTVNFSNTTACTSCTSLTTLWDYGDGNTSTVWQGSHTYANPGIYTVCLYETGINPNNVTCTDTFCTTITVGQTTNCMATLSSSVSGMTASFTPTVSGGTPPYTYFYNYGDGNTGSSATHTYATPGVYNACVTVTDANSLSCTACDSNVVIGQVSNCSVNLGTSVSGMTASFSPVVSGGTPPYTYFYNYGDGNTGSSATHTYANPGVYTACVTVTDTNNMSCTDCSTIVIGGTSTGCIATAMFNFTTSGLTANFNNTSTCNGCITTSYFWSFGDGNTSTVQNPTHTYVNAGAYTVCLLVTGVDSNNVSCTDSICQTLTFNTPPCQMTAAFSESINNLVVNFTNNSNCTGCSTSSYLWDFGDGSTTNTTGPTPVSHTYTTPGNYLVCLNGVGFTSNSTMLCNDSTCHNVMVSPNKIEESLIHHLNLYPNPVSQFLHIDLPVNEVVNWITLKDVSGRIVYESKTVPSGIKTLSLNLKSYTSGMYFLQVGTDKGFYISTVLKRD